MRFNNIPSRKMIAWLIVCSFLQICVGLALAAAPRASEETVSANATSMPAVPQIQGGRLITRNNQTVTVNGNSVGNGATVLPGASVETGTGVAATINLGALGSVEIAPNTKLRIEFSNGQIKVTIIEGCAIVKNRTGVSVLVLTEHGEAVNNESSGRGAGVTDVCYLPGAPSPIINQGAAANAGAGAGAAGGGSTQLKKLVLFGALGGGGAAALILGTRGSDTSQTQP